MVRSAPWWLIPALLGATMAVAAEETTVRSYPVPNHGSLELQVPKSWKDELRQPPNWLPPTIVFRPESGDAFDVQVTVAFPARRDIPLPKLGEIRASVEQEARRMMSEVGAQPMDIKPIYGASAQGFYFSASETKYKPGEFQHVTQGMVRVGDVVPAFRILTNDGSEAAVRSLLAMIESAALASSAADRAAEASAPKTRDVKVSVADGAEAQALQSDVRRILTVMYGGSDDVDFVVKSTYRRVAEQAGGEAAVRAAVEGAMGRVLQARLSIKELAFPEVPSMVRTAQRTYAIVPTRLVLTTGSDRLESSNFQIGIREPESTAWTYLEGSRFSEAMRREWFPDFPVDYAFPRVSREKK